MAERPVHNQVTTGRVGGHVFQAGRSLRITNADLSTGRAPGGPDVGASAEALLALLRGYGGPVERRRTTELALSHIAELAQDPGARAEVAELWADLEPALSGLAGAVRELTAMTPHIRVISDGVR